MNCRESQRHLPGYLDGAIAPRDRARLREHLESCGSCRREIERYAQLSVRLASVEAVAPPADLALRIRVQVSQRRSRWAPLGRLWSRAALVSQNILRPLAVPATGGVLTAIAVFVIAVQSMLMGMPIGGVAADDLPLNLVQPAQLESLAPFPVPGIEQTTAFPIRALCCSKRRSTRRARLSTTRFFPVRPTLRCGTSSIRFCCFPASARSSDSGVRWAAVVSC